MLTAWKLSPFPDSRATIHVKEQDPLDNQNYGGMSNLHIFYRQRVGLIDPNTVTKTFFDFLFFPDTAKHLASED
jgi:hypothetical protein